MSKNSKNKNLGDGWVLYHSKRRQGRSYLFNKRTGETKWCEGSEGAQDIMANESTANNDQIKLPTAEDVPGTSGWSIKTATTTKPEVPTTTPNVRIKLKTPANDRLKRLQREIRTKQDKTKDKVLSRKSKHANVADIISPMPLGKYKMTIEKEENYNKTDHEKPSTSSSSIVTLNKPPQTSRFKEKTEYTHNNKLKIFSNKATPPEKIIPTDKTTNNSSPTKRTLKSISAAIVGPVYKKMKQMGQNTYTTMSTTKSDISKTEETESQLNNLDKIASKAVKQHEELKDSKKNIAKTTIPKQLPHLSVNSGSCKGQANERLKRLRKSLQHLQKVSPAKTNRISTQLQNHTATVTNLDIEEMDWETSEVADNDVSIDTAATPTTYTFRNHEPAISTPNKLNVNATIGEYIDIVGENITRLTAEKNKTKQKWKHDQYYFVLDTNVWLDQMAFIKDLLNMKPCDTNGVILYVPYRVLQELDKLKQQTVREGLKTRAARVIKFLNEQFNAAKNSPKIQAQSAIDEKNHLIDVTSPDDSIINCCLQVKKNVNNLILLTEDINLRNKAKCNDILVSTKSDLLQKQL